MAGKGARGKARKPSPEKASPDDLVPVALRLRRKALEKAKADAAAGNRPLSRHLRGLLERVIMEG